MLIISGWDKPTEGFLIEFDNLKGDLNPVTASILEAIREILKRNHPEILYDTIKIEVLEK